jgi:hypothetical protein
MKNKTAIFAVLLATLFVVTLSFQAMAAEEKAKGESISLTGEISLDGMLITDEGQTFELAGEIADEVKQLSGQRIQVMGTVMEEGGKQKIEVQDYMLKEKIPETQY